MPKASAQKFHQSNGSQLDNALLALRKDSRVLRHRRAFADCFGANPVASALGDRTRRDPDAAMRTYHVGLKQTLKTGTFYLAGNRNFLFGSDTEMLATPRIVLQPFLVQVQRTESDTCREIPLPLTGWRRELA